MADVKEFQARVAPNGSDSGQDIELHSAGGTQVADSRQRLDRFITLKPAVAFGLTVLCTWEGISLTLFAALLNGGPTALVYGTILSGIGTTAVAASLGELASITPVVGAQYRWTGLYAPRAMTPAFWSLMQGWLTVFSWIALCAAIPFLSGTAIQGLIILNDDTYVPQRWHGTLLMWAVLCLPVFFNIFARRALKMIEIFGGILHITFFIITVVTLVVMAPRSPTSFVFKTSFFGFSGWTNEGVQWCIGLLSITAVLTGFDGVLHLSDEVIDAPKKVPRSMVLAVSINSIIALGYLIALLYCMGDVDAALGSPTGFPIIEIYYQATKSKAGTTVLVVMLLFSNTVALFGVFASVARLTWAFARDKGMPFSNYFSHVHPTLRIPLRALLLNTVIAALLGLINLGSTAAFFAIISLQALGLYVSYAIPLLFVLLRRLEGRPPPPGPWHLGKWSLPVNIVGLAFCIFIIVWLPFPSALPVTAANMNYAGPIIICIFIFALADWVISGRKRFEVPTSKPE